MSSFLVLMNRGQNQSHAFASGCIREYDRNQLRAWSGSRSRPFCWPSEPLVSQHSRARSKEEASEKRAAPSPPPPQFCLATLRTCISLRSSAFLLLRFVTDPLLHFCTTYVWNGIRGRCIIIHQLVPNNHFHHQYSGSISKIVNVSESFIGIQFHSSSHYQFALL